MQTRARREHFNWITGQNQTCLWVTLGFRKHSWITFAYAFWKCSYVSFWKARLRSEGHRWAVLAHSGRVSNPASKSVIPTLGIVLIPQSTIRLIQPLDAVTPFKHNSTQAMNETSESLYCHSLPSSWRRSSPAPPLLLCLPSLNLLFSLFSFSAVSSHSKPPPTQPTVR